jgi:hypothetical protein
VRWAGERRGSGQGSVQRVGLSVAAGTPVGMSEPADVTILPGPASPGVQVHITHRGLVRLLIEDADPPLTIDLDAAVADALLDALLDAFGP